jgi:hypothetical protein
MVSPPRSAKHAAPVRLTQEQVEAARAGRGKHALGQSAKQAEQGAPSGKPAASKAAARRKRS